MAFAHSSVGSHWCRLAGLVGVVAVLAGCASTAGPSQWSWFGPAYPNAPAQAATPDYRYIIGPGDTININVWRNPELSMGVTVRPDGRVSGALVEDVMAMGKTPTQLAREMEQILAKYIQDPIVTVITAGGSPPYSEQIRVVGEAAKPQALSYKQNMTLLDLMIAVGGITDFADGNRAILMRVSEGGKLYNLRIKDLIRRGDVTANVDMKPGDILIIPESWF